MSTCSGVSCTLANLTQSARRAARDLEFCLVLRVDFASHECKTAAAVWSLGSAEIKLSVAAKFVFNRALG